MFITKHNGLYVREMRCVVGTRLFHCVSGNHSQLTRYQVYTNTRLEDRFLWSCTLTFYTKDLYYRYCTTYLCRQCYVLWYNIKVMHFLGVKLLL